MVGFEKLKGELAAVDATVFAASVDPIDKAGLVAAEVSFPVGYGVLGFVTSLIGAWLYNILASVVGGIELDVQ